MPLLLKWRQEYTKETTNPPKIKDMKKSAFIYENRLATYRAIISLILCCVSL